MAPVIYDFKYYKGDTHSFIIYPKTAEGTPFDLADYTATFDIADMRGLDPTREKFRIIPTVDSSEDTVLCIITPENGNLLDPDKVYFYDVTIEGPATHTFVTGSITVSDSVVGV